MTIEAISFAILREGDAFSILTTVQFIDRPALTARWVVGIRTREAAAAELRDLAYDLDVLV